MHKSDSAPGKYGSGRRINSRFRQSCCSQLIQFGKSAAQTFSFVVSKTVKLHFVS